MRQAFWAKPKRSRAREHGVAAPDRLTNNAPSPVVSHEKGRRDMDKDDLMSRTSISRRAFAAGAMVAAATVGAGARAYAAQVPAGAAGSAPADGGAPAASGDVDPNATEGGAAGNAPTGGVGMNQSQEPVEGQLGSWNQGGSEDYDFHAAIFVSDDGIDKARSDAGRVQGGSVDDEGADGIAIDDATSGDNGVIVKDATYTVTGATIDLRTDADGSDTCDFSGRGTAIACYGPSTVVEVSDSTIRCEGVATMPFFTDDGATLTVRDTTFSTAGGTLYKDYLNSPDQATMVAPPWILGIMGTSRASNVMGDDSTMNVLDCDASAGAWGVLSVDAGSGTRLNVYNTTVTATNADESAAPKLQQDGGQIAETLDNPYTTAFGPAYGTYAIGNSIATFAGCSINVGTYAAILTGGTVVCTDIKKGSSYQLRNDHGVTTAVYEATTDKPTTIHSDTFGFMAHQGTNTLALDGGTTVESGFATFLVKTGSSQEALTATIDDATIKNGGVLVQVMDNDDATTGGMMGADDPRNINGGSMNFIPEHKEAQGFTLDAGADNDGTVQTFTFSHGTYEGCVYNASGSDAAVAASRLAPTTLRLVLRAGATLKGAVASTAAIHVTYDGSVEVRDARKGVAFDDAEEAAAFAKQYQNTDFDITHYFDIGQVANLVNENGGNAVEVELSDDAVWNVTATSLVKKLTIGGAATVVVPKDVTLTVDGTAYSGVTLAKGDL